MISKDKRFSSMANSCNHFSISLAFQEIKYLKMELKDSSGRKPKPSLLKNSLKK